MLDPSPDRSPVLRLIEFVGPPSAGKSTLLRAILTGPGRAAGWTDGVLLARRPRLPVAGRRALVVASRHPPLAPLLFRAPGEARIIAALDAARPLLGPLLARAGRGSDRPDDPVLAGLQLRWGLEAAATRALLENTRSSPASPAVAALDEGLTHPYKVAAFFGPAPAAGELSALPMPDVLVDVRVAPSTLIGRLRRRRDMNPSGPRERTWGSDDALEEEATRLLGAVDAVIDEAGRRGVAVVSVDGARSPSEIARELVKAIDAAVPGDAR